ncbi:MAG: family 78 glycoside hydrolase catalytic domain [Lachnospiraceae bacterium]|nr:family 78 glycoside hydrolase catalytic domain [Lachnospiraceae bacterium]
MLNITGIKINYQKEPIGITQVDQIGWIMESEKRNTIQTAFWIQISKDDQFSHIIWDSSKQESKESVHYRPEGFKPDSTSKYYIRVKIWTNHDEESEWKTSCFVTALLSTAEWKAQFITIEEDQDADESRGSYLRNRIFINSDKAVKSAYLYSTALGLYHVFINGKKISQDEFAPGWTSYQKHLLYQMYDVTEYLNASDNVIAAHIGAGWYKGTMGFVRMRNHYGKRTAFACQLVIEYSDGSREVRISDTDWSGAWSPVTFSEIYDGEVYDASLEIADWNMAQCQYNGWNACKEVVFDRSILHAQSGCKVKEIERLPVKQIIQTPKGDTVLDFGQNMTGWIEFNATGKKGDRVELQCFEVLDAQGNVYLDNLRTAKQTVTYLFGQDGTVTFHPNFTFQGFQYALVKEYPCKPDPKDFVAVVLHSDMNEAGTFVSSNQDVNQLWHNIKWGMKGNFLDVPTDCPQRDERLGWTGDAQIFCRTASYLMDTYTFYTKWLRDVAADQTEEGGVPHVVPDLLIGKSQHDRLMKDGDHSAAAWADVAVILPWTLYQVYGDKTVIVNQYESMKAWIDFMQEHAVDYIWNYKLQFGDWVALDAEEGSYFGATPNDLTCTAYFAYVTKLFYKMAEVIGRQDDVKIYRDLYEKIRQTYHKTFFDHTGRLTARTQTAQIISLYFDLVPEEYRKNVVEDLLLLLEQENGHLVTGFVGTPYFCHALSQNGHTKEAYELLLKEDFPSWIYQVKKGATTIWEHWDGLKDDGTMWSPDMNSFNHYAYGAVGEWISRVAVGIEIDEEFPGYEHSIICPHIGGNFTRLGGSYQSVYGTISSKWEIEEQNVTLHVSIPCNATATIRLTDAEEVSDADGLIFQKNDSGFTAEAGSGDYQIKFRLSFGLG